VSDPLLSESLEDRIDALIDPLLTERARLSSLREELIRRRAALDAELAKVDRILKAAGYRPDNNGQPKATKLPLSRTNPVSPQRKAAVYDVLRKTGAKMSQTEIATALHVASSSVHNALAHLRRDGTVRLAGYRGNEKLYALHDGTPENPNALSIEPSPRTEAEEIAAEVLARFVEIGPEGANVSKAAEGMRWHSSTVSNYIQKLIQEGKLEQIRVDQSPRGRDMAIYAVKTTGGDE
jgi:Mn-dependent DtxR family transcriptional regulator